MALPFRAMFGNGAGVSPVLMAALPATPYMKLYSNQDGELIAIDNPSTAPTAQGLCVAMSPLHAAISYNATPWVRAYSVSDETFTACTVGNPKTGSDPANCVALSPDENYMALGSGHGANALTIYRLSGTTYNKLFANNIGIDILAAAFSPDSTYLAVAGGTGGQTPPYLKLYKIDNGTNTFDDSAATISAPGFACRSVAWSPDGNFLAVGSTFYPYIDVYSKSGDVFTHLSPIDTTSPSTDRTVWGCAWSPDSTYLATARTASPFLTIYKNSPSGTFAKLSDPASLPSGSSRGISATWNADGGLLAVATDATPYLNLYSRSGDVLTKIASPVSLPTNTDSIAFSPT